MIEMRYNITIFCHVIPLTLASHVTNGINNGTWHWYLQWYQYCLQISCDITKQSPQHDKYIKETISIMRQETYYAMYALKTNMSLKYHTAI